jgi:hypothetical protein
MTRCSVLLAIATMAACALAADLEISTQTVTWTGWFADFDCASGKAASGIFKAGNPICAEQCIRKGSPAVFVSEQAKAIFKVKDYPSVIDDLGYNLEVQGRVDAATRTIAIVSVKRLEYEGASCSRPRKPAAKK